MKIFIDPGHGGSSIGAAYKGRKEQDDCLRLALAVKEHLLTQKNVEVKMSRTTDINPTITQRCADANTWGADYFISIHRNASSPNKATGAEAWIYSKCKKGGTTYAMAEKVLKAICEVTEYKNRGVKLGAVSYVDFGVNSGTNMHSCLVEVGFIDNDNDNDVFECKLNEIAKAIAKSIYEVNGGKWVEKPVEAEEKTQDASSGVTYIVQIGAFFNKANAEAYAEKAKKEGFDAIITVKGDIDGNGEVSASDARQVLRMAVGMEG